MKNKAKCKLCNSIIESFHATDYVMCKCGEIAVDGGESLRCYANDFSNFLRVDDEGNEIVISVRDRLTSTEQPTAAPQLTNHESFSRQDLIKTVEDMIKTIEALPQQALSTSVNQYDYLSLLFLFLSLLRAES